MFRDVAYTEFSSLIFLSSLIALCYTIKRDLQTYFLSQKPKMISNSKTESANTIIVIEAPLKPTAALPPSSKSTDRKTKKWIPLFATVLALLAGIFLYLWIAGGKSQPTAASPINVSALNSSEINKLFTVDGKCGFQGGVTTTCSESLPCCSQYSWCGSSPDHCSNQQIAFSFQSQQAVVVAATSASTQQIPSWETCFTPSSDVCAEAGFSCCVSPHDVSTKKFTCRPTTDASECSIYPSSSSSVVVAPSASSDGTCGGASGFSCPASMPCCSQHNWCGSSADHCNSYSLAQFSFGGSVSVVAPAPSSPISYSSPSTQSSSSSASMWVTPYQMGNGYTASNWPNPGGKHISASAS